MVLGFNAFARCLILRRAGCLQGCEDFTPRVALGSIHYHAIGASMVRLLGRVQELDPVPYEIKFTFSVSFFASSRLQ